MYSLLLFLFMLKRGEYVSELLSPTGVLFILQMIGYMGMEPRWNDIDRRKPKNSEENLSQCYFVYLISHMDGPEREPWSLRWCKCTFTFLSLISLAH
jgi:hypothetical protein